MNSYGLHVISKEEVRNILPLAMEFYSDLPVLDVKEEAFVSSWETLVDIGIGVIIADKEYHGAVAMLISPDLNNGNLIATEGFWFVSKRRRGNRLSVYLLSAMESEAARRGCQRVIMVHMSDSMPERLRRFYLKRGYSPLEVHYIKEV